MIIMILYLIIFVTGMIFILNYCLKDNIKIIDIRNELDIRWYISDKELENMRRRLNNKYSKF